MYHRGSIPRIAPKIKVTMQISNKQLMRLMGGYLQTNPMGTHNEFVVWVKANR